MLDLLVVVVHIEWVWLVACNMHTPSLSVIVQGLTVIERKLFIPRLLKEWRAYLLHK